MLVRLASVDDAPLFLESTTEPGTRERAVAKHSLSPTTLEGWRNHLAIWTSPTYAASLAAFIGAEADDSVGWAMLSVSNATAELSYVVLQRFRHRGHGERLARHATRYAFEHSIAVQSVIAFIEPGNVGSECIARALRMTEGALVDRNGVVHRKYEVSRERFTSEGSA